MVAYLGIYDTLILDDQLFQKVESGSLGCITEENLFQGWVGEHASRVWYWPEGIDNIEQWLQTTQTKANYTSNVSPIIEVFVSHDRTEICFKDLAKAENIVFSSND